MTRQIGGELLARAREHRAGVLSSRFWSDRLMEWAMKDPAFKVQLFRFVDVFPMLRDSRQVHEYLTEYLSEPGVRLPGWMDLGLKAGGLAKGLFAATVTGRIKALAETFIAGTDADAALPTLESLWDGGFGLSGTETQAGGPEYLLNFVQPCCVCENTLRHGFAPGLE